LSKNEINLDFDRQNRTGLAEAVFCLSKSDEQLLAICQQINAQDKPMLFTRMSTGQYQAIDNEMPGLLEYDPDSGTAFHGAIPPADGHRKIAIVTGGSSDIPVAREASRTLAFYGHQALEVNDVGVAGLWRLQQRLPELQTTEVIICVAGMDAALPTVLGGLVPALIIAVPSSVGYGMARGGETALNALLSSCAPGLVVVNIDNGYGAACGAIRAAGDRREK